MNWVKQAKLLPLITRAVNSNPWYLILYVTSHCNQRCNMCFVHEMLNTLKRSEEFSLEEFEKIAGNFPGLYQLTLTGGEPTLRADLAEIIEIFYRVSGTQRVTVPTNAYYTDRVESLVNRVMETCPGLTLSINMSIDGVREVHDKIRGLPGSFDNLVATYNRLRELQRVYTNLHLATASVLTVSNQDSMPSLLEFIDKNFDINNHGIMIARGDIPTDEGRATTAEKFIEILYLHHAMTRNGSRIVNAVQESYLASRVDTLRNKKMRDPCQAGKKLLIINERGEVSPCEILGVLAANGETDEPDLGNFSFGNIREHDFNLGALLNSDRGKAIRRFIVDERCWCTFECAQINNFALSPKAHLRTLGKVIMPQSN